MCFLSWLILNVGRDVAHFVNIYFINKVNHKTIYLFFKSVNLKLGDKILQNAKATNLYIQNVYLYNYMLSPAFKTGWRSLYTAQMVPVGKDINLDGQNIHSTTWWDCDLRPEWCHPRNTLIKGEFNLIIECQASCMSYILWRCAILVRSDEDSTTTIQLKNMRWYTAYGQTTLSMPSVYSKYLPCQMSIHILFFYCFPLLLSISAFAYSLFLLFSLCIIAEVTLIFFYRLLVLTVQGDNVLITVKPKSTILSQSLQSMSLGLHL